MTGASSVEFVARLTAMEHGEERWLVRATGTDSLRVAWIFADDDHEWLVEIERQTRSWIGFAHPRVSRVLALAWLDRRLVVAVEDDRGPLLGAAAAQIASPSDRERWIVAQVIAIAEGLAAMQRQTPKFVHRRLEPHKLFVDASGHARLRAPVHAITVGPMRNYLGRGRSTGISSWLSPEQCRGQNLRPASDVFSLASQLVYVLSGRHPWRRDGDLATLEAIIKDPPPAFETHAPGLARVIERALAKEPAQRYHDPAELAAALRACVPDAADYDACMSDVIAAWWPTTTREPDRDQPGRRHVFGDRCSKRWEELSRDGSEDIRYCNACDQHVVQVSSIAAAVPLVGKRCFKLQTVE